jgi:hypothetical protein
MGETGDSGDIGECSTHCGGPFDVGELGGSNDVASEGGSALLGGSVNSCVLLAVSLGHRGA